MKESNTPKNEAMYQLSQKEQQLVRYHRLLDEREQEEIMDFITTLVKERRNKK